MTGTVSHFSHGLLMLGVAASAAGCAVEVGAPFDEDTARIEQEVGEPTCLTIPANRTFTGGASPAYVSPAIYGTSLCTKSFIVDIVDYSSIYTLPGAGGGAPGRTVVSWADTVPTTATACNNLSIGTGLYYWTGTRYQQVEYRLSRGRWIQGGILNFCVPPSSTFTTQMVAGRSYRFTVSARPYPGETAPVRKARVESLPHEVIH
jgi:hypothetical protein